MLTIWQQPLGRFPQSRKELKIVSLIASKEAICSRWKWNRLWRMQSDPFYTNAPKKIWNSSLRLKHVIWSRGGGYNKVFLMCRGPAITLILTQVATQKAYIYIWATSWKTAVNLTSWLYQATVRVTLRRIWDQQRADSSLISHAISYLWTTRNFVSVTKATPESSVLRTHTLSKREWVIHFSRSFHSEVECVCINDINKEFNISSPCYSHYCFSNPFDLL